MTGSFSANIAKWVGDTKEETKELHKAIILELFTSVILDTPVLSGRLRGNWIISSDSPESGQFDVIDTDGTKTTKRVEDFVTNLDLGKKDFSVYLANNLPYAYRIEFDGYSGKAPEGMVRKNMVRISNNLKS